jgi:hypothetical protein
VHLSASSNRAPPGGELLAAAKIARELFDPRLSRVLSDAIIIAVLAASLTLLAASSPSGRRSMACC